MWAWFYAWHQKGLESQRECKVACGPCRGYRTAEGPGAQGESQHKTAEGDPAEDLVVADAMLAEETADSQRQDQGAREEFIERR